MDFFTICCFLLILFGILLYYVTRETSYEQALEEQRSKNEFDLLTSSNANAKHENKKEKSKKFKDKETGNSKKSKEKVSVKQTTNKVSKNNKIPLSVSNETKFTEVKVVKNESSSSEEVPIQQEELISKEEKKPEKKQEIQPMVLNKITENSSVREINTTTSAVQSASVVEIMDSSVPQSEQSNKTNQIPIRANNSNLKLNNKKSKKSVNAKVSREFNMNEIIESIKLLTKEDVTFLTDYLLNMQADDQINDLNWHKKNDPIESLKKQLAEKEETISTQKNNLEIAKRKLEFLQNEIYLNKRYFQKEKSLRNQIESEKNDLLRMINDLEQKNKQQIEKLDEQNRLLQQEELAKLNVIQDLKTKNANLQVKISENEKLIDQLEEKTKILDISNQNLLQMKDIEKEKNLLEENLRKTSEQYRIDVEGLNAENTQIHSKNNKLQEENMKLKNEIEELKKSLDDNKEAVEENKQKMTKEKNDLLKELDDLSKEKKSLVSELNKIQECNKKNIDLLETICIKLNLGEQFEDSNNSTDQIIQSIDELKTTFLNYESINNTYTTLNDSYKRIMEENEHLKQELNEKQKKCKSYEITLAETDETLNEIQDKILKQKTYYELELSKRDKQIASIKEESNFQIEKINLLNEEKIKLNEKYEKINELYLEKENEFFEIQNQKKLLMEQLEIERTENKNLSKKNEKLNELVQIGVCTYQEENKKVQDLETKLAATLNGGNGNNVCPKETASSMPTTNGN